MMKRKVFILKNRYGNGRYTDNLNELQNLLDEDWEIVDTCSMAGGVGGEGRYPYMVSLSLVILEKKEEEMKTMDAYMDETKEAAADRYIEAIRGQTAQWQRHKFPSSVVLENIARWIDIFSQIHGPCNDRLSAIKAAIQNDLDNRETMIQIIDLINPKKLN